MAPGSGGFSSSNGSVARQVRAVRCAAGAAVRPLPPNPPEIRAAFTPSPHPRPRMATSPSHGSEKERSPCGDGSALSASCSSEHSRCSSAASPTTGDWPPARPRSQHPEQWCTCIRRASGSVDSSSSSWSWVCSWPPSGRDGGPAVRAGGGIAVTGPVAGARGWTRTTPASASGCRATFRPRSSRCWTPGTGAPMVPPTGRKPGLPRPHPGPAHHAAMHRAAMRRAATHRPAGHHVEAPGGEVAAGSGGSSSAR